MLKRLHSAIWLFLDQFKPVPLHWALTIPFVLQLVTAVLLVGWLSWQSGQYAVNDLATQLRTEITASVAHYLEDYLCVPQKINQLNLKLLNLDLTNPKAVHQMSELFVKQMQLFDVSYINYGSVDGQFIGVEKEPNTSPNIILVDPSQPLQMKRYKTNAAGQQTTLVATVPYNFQQERWYTDAIATRQAGWSSVYQWNDQPEILSISSSYPVYDKDQNLLGVLGVDQTISDIDQFLQHLNISRYSQVFLVERSGLLLATSSKQPAYEIKGDKAERITAINSHEPIISATSQFLVKKFGSFQNIAETQQLEFQYFGERQRVQIMPWGKSLGLGWLIIVVSPESTLMENIHAGFRVTIASCFVILLLSMWIMSLFARKISAPIFRLSRASQRIAAGELDQIVEANGITEIKLLAESFNQMSRKLRSSFTHLERINEKLEERVAERTIALRQSEEKFFKAFWSSPVAIAITNTEGRLIEVNSSFCQLLGYSSAEMTGRGSCELGDWINSLDHHNITQQLEVRQAMMKYECQLRRKSGRTIDVEISVDRIQLDRQPRLLFVATDITERKLAEKALRESEQRFRSVVETIECVFWMLDLQQQTVIYLSPAFEKIWGYSCEDIYKNSHILTDSIHPDDRGRALNALRQLNPNDYNEEYRIVRSDGGIRWIHDRAFPIIDTAGNTVYITGIAEDITDQKETEKIIQKSLQEKEVLLKEIHHRVKNNLHIISNLLDLQASITDQPEISELFTNAQNRIHAMALIHEQLYQSHDLSQVSFSDYIERLIINIFCSWSENLVAIQPVIQAEPIYLNLETAIPCGLLLNELVVNSLKHAFPNHQSGQITVNFYQDEQSQFHLVVADNGIGIAAPFDWRNYSSLGFKLIQILTKQLRAKIDISSQDGIIAHLVFKELKYQPRF